MVINFVHWKKMVVNHKTDTKNSAIFYVNDAPS